MLRRPKVYITRELPGETLEAAKEHFEVEVWPQYRPPSKQELMREIRDADALVTLLTDKIDAEVLNAAAKLKIISQMAVGCDNIDVEEATKRGIYVTNTPGVLTETTADLAWALLMAVSRRIVEADKYVRAGRWKVAWHPCMFLGRDVYGATLGIIGAGRIGTAMARRARGFNMQILYYSRTRKSEIEEIGAKYADLETLLKESDFVTIHVPLSQETHHMIDEEKLRLMKKTAYLINTSRGQVVDEKALYEALKRGWISGAALDVFEQEPTPMDNPLLKLKNIVTTPHIGSASYATRSRMAEMVMENLKTFFNGKAPPPNLVNPEVIKIIKT